MNRVISENELKLIDILYSYTAPEHTKAMAIAIQYSLDLDHERLRMLDLTMMLHEGLLNNIWPR